MTQESPLEFTGPASQVRREVAARLAAAGVPSADVDAAWLVAEVLETTPPRLALGGELDADQANILAAWVARRTEREPLQHILGSAAFRHLSVAVGPGVFVPRPETETLVDLALTVLAGAVAAGGMPDGAATRAVDLCSGSGVIALALATERPGTTAWAVELDSRARGWLDRNVAAHQQLLAQQGSAVVVVAGDATAPPEAVPRGVDVVTCNPPYIPDDAVPRDPEVAQHDPAVALYGGPDGLDVVRGVVAAAATLLRPGGWLLIEHGDQQGADDGVPGVVAAHGGFSDVADHCDNAGRPRVTVARRL